jgi:hypothetical protein
MASMLSHEHGKLGSFKSRLILIFSPRDVSTDSSCTVSIRKNSPAHQQFRSCRGGSVLRSRTEL